MFLIKLDKISSHPTIPKNIQILINLINLDKMANNKGVEKFLAPSCGQSIQFSEHCFDL